MNWIWDWIQKDYCYGEFNIQCHHVQSCVPCRGPTCKVLHVLHTIEHHYRDPATDPQDYLCVSRFGSRTFNLLVERMTLQPLHHSVIEIIGEWWRRKWKAFLKKKLIAVIWSHWIRISWARSDHQGRRWRHARCALRTPRSLQQKRWNHFCSARAREISLIWKPNASFSSLPFLRLLFSLFLLFQMAVEIPCSRDIEVILMQWLKPPVVQD